MRELMTKHLKSDASQLWMARTRVSAEVWFGWLVAASKLKRISLSPCSTQKTSYRLLLKKIVAKEQKRYKSFVFRDGESPGYLYTFAREVRTSLCVNLELCLYAPYSRARKKLYGGAFSRK